MDVMPSDVLQSLSDDISVHSDMQVVPILSVVI